MTDRLAELSAQGVAVWLDDLSRVRLTSGSLKKMLHEQHVVGVTTNPSIFQKALSDADAYDAQVKDLQLMGVTVEDRKLVQVSMNLTNYKETSMTAVFDAVAREASADGVRILESEIVGLVPADALPPDPARRLKVRKEDLDRVLEERLEKEEGRRKTE